MMRTSNINALYLASVPFLSIYALPNGLQLNWLLVCLLIILNLGNISKMTFFKTRKNEVQWFSAIMLIGFFGVFCNIDSNYFDTTIFLHNLLAIILFFISLIIITNDCNINVFKRTLFICGIAASAICIYQRIQLLLTGSFEANVFIPGLIVNRDLDTFSINRVSSFFTEPAHLAIYLLPIYYISLFDKKILISLFCAIGVLFSGSSTGFLLIFVLTFVYMFKNNIAKKYIFIVVSIGVIVFILINKYFPDVLLDNINKIESTSSNNQRQLGPLSYIQYMDIGQLIFGVGFNQLAEFLRSNGVLLLNEWGVEINANYANAIIYSFLSYGLLGFVFCVKYIYCTIISNKSNLGFVCFALGILLSDQVLFNRNLLYLITFLIFSSKLLNTAEHS